jgi:hypothetical protein
MKPFMNPIEKPNSFAMKLAYYFSKKQFGKVIAPLRVIGPRMPAAFRIYFAKIEQLDKKWHYTSYRRNRVQLALQRVFLGARYSDSAGTLIPQCAGFASGNAD